MDSSKLDFILGILALIILGAGLLMLFSGVKNMND
jgi:hypothetical protein